MAKLSRGVFILDGTTVHMIQPRDALVGMVFGAEFRNSISKSSDLHHSVTNE